MDQFLAPIAIFGYNRPVHLRHSLLALSKAVGASCTPLWIFCDGPKVGTSPGANKAVQAVACDPEWAAAFASVEVKIADQNNGLARSIIGGVSQVLETSDHVIVLEDDLIVSTDFIRFMNDMLAFYRDDTSVGSLTGFCPLTRIPVSYSADIMAVPRNSSCGWATWKDRWSKVDWTAAQLPVLLADTTSRRRFNSAGSDRLDRLRRQLDGQIDSWSIRFGLWQFLAGKNTIYPTCNRIVNIGYDGTGVHSGIGRPKNDAFGVSARPYELSRVDPDPEILRAFRVAYSGSLTRRILRWVRTELWAGRRV
jgi:hypothetical protein